LTQSYETVPKMQRFSIGFLGTFIIGFGAVWIWVASNFIVFMDRGYAMWAAKMQIAHNCTMGRLAILGDSRPMADIIPPLVGAGVVNLAFGGVTAVENYIFAKQILNCSNLPKAVILSLTPVSFKKIGKLVDQAAYNGLLTFSDLEDIRNHTREMNYGPYDLDFKQDIELRVKEVGYATRFPPYYFSQVKDAFISPHAWENKEVFDYTSKMYGWFWDFMPGNPFGHSHAEETGWDDFTPFPFSDYYLHQLLALFESKHIPVYFVAMPYNEDSFQIMKPEFIEAYTAYINSVVKQYPGTHILGPLFSSIPWDKCYDSYHLNPQGARMYSERLRQLLNSSHVEGGPYIADPEAIGNVNW